MAIQTTAITMFDTRIRSEIQKKVGAFPFDISLPPAALRGALRNGAARGEKNIQSGVMEGGVKDPRFTPAPHSARQL
jgi:hypothetical protein